MLMRACMHAHTCMHTCSVRAHIHMESGSGHSDLPLEYPMLKYFLLWILNIANHWVTSFWNRNGPKEISTSLLHCVEAPLHWLLRNLQIHLLNKCQHINYNENENLELFWQKGMHYRLEASWNCLQTSVTMFNMHFRWILLSSFQGHSGSMRQQGKEMGPKWVWRPSNLRMATWRKL